MSERFISSQFCDDIRLEVGNKYSLIGCYGPVIVMSPFPAVLPKLCVHVKVYTPITQPFQKLIVRVILGDNALGQLAFDAEHMDRQQQTPLDSAQHQVAMAMITMSPLPINEPCKLRVEAETEDAEMLYGGSLWFRTPDSVGMPPLTPFAFPAPAPSP